MGYERDYLDQLNERNPPAELAAALNLPLKGGRAQCVFHGGDGYNLSFKGRTAYCFACRQSFDAIAIVRRALGGWGQRDAPFAEAVEWLEARTPGVARPGRPSLAASGASAPRPAPVWPAGPARAAEKIYVAPPPRTIQLLDLVTPWLEEELWAWEGRDPAAPGNPLALLRRRLKSDAAIRQYRLGYSPGPHFLAERLPPEWHALATRHGLLDAQGRDRLAYRVSIPESRLVRLGGSVSTHVVSLTTRAVLDPPAWQHDARKHLYLSNLTRPLIGLQRAIGRGPYVVVTEGFFKSAAAERWGYPAVALGSSEPSEEIIGELRLLFRTATLLLVPDRDGRPWWRDEEGRLCGRGQGPRGMARTVRRLRLESWQRVAIVRVPPDYKGLDDLDDGRPDARALFAARVASAVCLAQRGLPGVPRHGHASAQARNSQLARQRHAALHAGACRPSSGERRAPVGTA